MANTCAICGASINLFQSQKLADGNYLCRKECCKKALTKYFDFVHATLPEYQCHAAQVERGTKIWEQLFVPRLKEKDKAEKLERHYQPLIVAPSLGLAALLETRYKFMNFGKSEHACVFRLDDLVCYETEKETKTVDGKQQTEYYIHYAFRNTSGLSDFRVSYASSAECQSVEKYFNKLFGIPIHQAHSYCHCESMSHISGCATIRTAGSDTQPAITGGWLPPRRRPAIGLTILPSSHSPSVISGISTVKPSQAMGAVAREPREGEIPVEPTAIGRLMTSQ